MLLIYCAAGDQAAIDRVQDAYPTKRVTVRDVAEFHAYDADPLDQVVYAPASATAIAEAYARFPQVQVLALDATPLPMVSDETLATLPEIPMVPVAAPAPMTHERMAMRGAAAREAILHAREARKGHAEAAKPKSAAQAKRAPTPLVHMSGPHVGGPTSAEPAKPADKAEEKP